MWRGAVGDPARADHPVRDAWPLLLGFAALAIPTAASLSQQEWTRDYGAHEPIVCLIGGWLIWRERRSIGSIARPGHWLPTWLALLAALPMYGFGRAFDFPTLETLGLYGVGLALLHAALGPAVLLRLWFPLLFISLAIPPPRALLDSLTGPLKELVSVLAASGLKAVGLPVGRQGVIIFVAQYELLVEDACSGMNSLMGLTAVSLLYGYFARGASVATSIFMVCLAIPVAMAANVARVALLVLVTYTFGDAVGQSFLHYAAGIFLFAAALALVFIIDKAAHAAFIRLRRA
jgi:exosortase